MENNDGRVASGLLVPDFSDDSVDIYDDLDVCFSTDAGKSPQETSKLKESMDLYEEIVTEEQRNRESCHADLKSRFQAAQNQIKELRRRLEEMEIQNTKLSTENCSLKKNISALFRTAKQEVTRKDAEIQRLNQWSLKGRHQFCTNQLQDQNFSSSRPPTSSPLSLSTPNNKGIYPQQNPSQLSEKERSNSIKQPTVFCTKTEASKIRSNCHSKSLTTPHSDLDEHKSKQRDGKYQLPKPSESNVWRQCKGSDFNKDCSAPDKTSPKNDQDPERKYDSRTCTSKTFLNTEGHRAKLHRAKSPLRDILDSTGSTGKSQKLRQDKDKLSTSHSEHSKFNSSRKSYSRDSRNSYRHKRSSRSRDRIKSSSSQTGERRRDSTKDGEGERLSKDYLRKVERRHEDKINRLHSRNSLLETSREQEKIQKQRAKELDQGDNNVCKKEKHKKHVTSERKSNRQITTEEESMEVNNPNKKLCFMETLNLTLSPIKKPSKNMDDPSVVKVVKIQSDKETYTVEDVCVIDKVGSSQLNDIAEQTSDIPKDTTKSCESMKNVQKENTSCTEGEVGKGLEDDSVQAMPAHKHSPVTTPNRITVSPTPKSLHSCIEQNNGNSIKLTPESRVDESGPVQATNSLINKCGNVSKEHTSSSSEKGNLNVYHPVAIIETSVPKSKENPPNSTVQITLPVASVENGPNYLSSGEVPSAEVVPGSPKTHHMSPKVLLQSCQQEFSPPALFCSMYKKEQNDGQSQGVAEDTEVLTSTVNLESLPQESLSLHEAIYILTQTTEDVSDSLADKPGFSASCVGVSKVTTKTEELVLSKSYCELNITPKKNFTPVKSNESSVEPSSSVPLLHDEESMMHTLGNLKSFPNAISPLRSPVRITRRNHLHFHVKPGHVRSLQTVNEFSNAAVDVNKKKLDVNKENTYPGSPANCDVQNMVDKAIEPLSSVSDKELEEGEILSEGEEATPDSPIPATKQAKLSQPVKRKPNHKTVLKRKSEELHLVSKEAPGTSTRSPKSRFKMVCPAATKVYFSNIDEIMETFQLVRSEIRKKYMKLHKTFPRKSFYGMMENFQESFLEFVEGAQFSQICNQAEKLKCRLKKLIASVFSKVSNNGIVKRIFEQQATDLKQKLWDFVDVQVDYLFKEIHTVLNSLCKTANTQTESSVKKEFQSAATSLSQIKTSIVVPYRTGLGSRGKDIRISHVENADIAEPVPTKSQKTKTAIHTLPTKNIPLSPDKNNMVSLMVSQNGSLLEKTDFEILTEQQASSLTFNLVRDSQMGEIFKCLLQGSDLLETSDMTEEGTAWSLTTPRKDRERLISITTPTKFDSPSKLLSPNKLDSPSKLISAWSSISPQRNMSSPRSKDAVTWNPALFDENCMLEVPSENRLLLQSSISSHKSHSILAEDLAVSLSIPSPLKSDSHLSFLQPFSMHIMSTPGSVIRAHISEDALLEGEDATEQDIHLTLDTDNSSCSSISSMASVACTTSLLLKPDQPMQALVMEKSNDHFIVKIRQAPVADVTLTADSSSETLGKEDSSQKESQGKAPLLNGSSSSEAVPSVLSNCADHSSICHTFTSSGSCLTQENSLTLTKYLSCRNEEIRTQQGNSEMCFCQRLQPLSDQDLDNTSTSVTQRSHCVCRQLSKTNEKDFIHQTVQNSTDKQHKKDDTQTQKRDLISGSYTVVSVKSCKSSQRSNLELSQCSDLKREDMEASESERSLIIAEDMSTTPEMDKAGCDKGRKRKKCGEKFKAKRCREEEEQTDNESNLFPASLSPNSLSARNVVRKKGEVVIAWTRDEDRAILVYLKKKGPSRETFSYLSTKLKKPSGQIAHRFYQLIKLFKKQEKTDA